MNNGRRQAGFTLIEFICVIILIAILAIGVYIQSPVSAVSIGAEASQVADDLRYTQSLAMSKDLRYSFVISSSTSYQILNSSGAAVINATGSSTTILKNGLSFGALVNLPNSLVAFDGRGTPYTTTGSPGTALAATASIPITDGGLTTTITISPQTGRVLI